jgi:hypothetical protein
MPRYRVTLTRTTIETVEAPNPYQAAITASSGGDGSDEVVDVRPAVGRPTKPASKSVKKAAKKRRPLSPQARAKLAQNLVKARAARAAKAKAAKTKTARRATKAKSTKKAGRHGTRKR